MCTPRVVQEALASLSRCDFLHLADHREGVGKGSGTRLAGSAASADVGNAMVLDGDRESRSDKTRKASMLKSAYYSWTIRTKRRLDCLDNWGIIP